MPSAIFIISKYTVIFPSTALPCAVHNIHVFKELDKSLILVGFFCYNGYTTSFDKKEVINFKKEAKAI